MSAHNDPSAKELVSVIRKGKSWCRASYCTGACERKHSNCVISLAADVIERLQAENDVLAAAVNEYQARADELERLLDEAVNNIPQNCVLCRNEYDYATCPVRKKCSGGELWEWKGFGARTNVNDREVK